MKCATMIALECAARETLPLLLCAKEVHGVNARRLMYKLQTALCANGVHVRIDQRQHWSDKAGRMLTIYEARKEDGALMCKSYRAVDVVQALAELLVEYGGGSA